MVLSDETFKQLSHSIASVRFPLVFAILLLHGYTTCLLSGHNTYYDVLYPPALWLGETGVPAYFFISGMLLFYSSKNYFQQLRSRFKTLFIPYMLWNGLLLLVFVAIWLLGFDSKINSKSLDDFTWLDYIRVFWDRGDRNWGNTMPMMTPMWYIRNLMVMYILSPILAYAIRLIGPMIPIVSGLFWINSHSVAFSLQTLTMFSLGAYFPLKEINPIDFWRQYKIHILFFFVCFGLADNYMHIVGIGGNAALVVHRLALVTNTFFMIWLGTYFYDRGWRFPRLSRAAFFIFCIHFPIMIGIRSVAAKHLEWPDSVHLLVYVVSVSLVTAICYGIFALLSRYAPWFIRISTGDRA